MQVFCKGKGFLSCRPEVSGASDFLRQHNMRKLNSQALFLFVFLSDVRMLYDSRTGQCIGPCAGGC